jgi:hypothetical protein
MKPVVTRVARAPACISAAYLWLLGTTALAQTTIGSAVQVERDVSGTFAGRTNPLSTGDGVLSNENIRTANASSAQLRFLDQSSLTIGPTSSVVLDHFVYNPDRSAREGTVQMAIGAARWVGGATQSHDAYQVQTPHAIIGVRGTVFELLVEANRTTVTLREGTIVVCLVHRPQHCVTVTTPDSVLTVTSTEIRGPTPNAPSPTQFADNCLSPVDRRLSSCATQAFTSSPYAFVTASPSGDAWSGFYGGVNLGYGTQSLGNSIAASPFTQTNPFGFDFPGGSSSANGRLNGAIGGVQFGHNWQFASHWLAGVETDLQASGQKGSIHDVFSGTTSGVACTSLLCTYTNTTDITAKLSWFGTTRGRVGTELNGLWLYGTGGLAYGELSFSGINSFTVTGSGLPMLVYSTPINYSLTKVGWVVGGGIEGRLGVSQWTWKVEYLHIDLGSIGTHDVGSLPAVTINGGTFTDEIVRLGINYPLSH